MSLAGRLRTRLALQGPVETPDGQGGMVRGFETVATVWAEVTWLAARESVTADDAGADQCVRILLRREHEVTPAHRLADGARIYRIIAVRASARPGAIEIDAEQRLA